MRTDGARAAETRLSLCGVGFSYGTRRVLRGVDLDIARGERLAVLGPNGAGKTTLLRILSGILEPGAGEVRLDGAPLAALRSVERARRIALVPQESRIAFDFTVLEIVLMGRAPRLGLLGIEGRHDLEQARLALEFTDAAHLADRRVSRLSSGERQRVLLARALAQEPETILLDEPTAFLDLGHQVRIHELLESLNRERGTTIVFVSHDLSLAARHAGRIVLFSEGRLVADGPPAAVLTPEIVRSAYGVEVRILTDPVSGTPAVFPIGLRTGCGSGPGPGSTTRSSTPSRSPR